MFNNALRLPRISISDRDQEQMTDILNELPYAKAIVMFYETKKGEYKCLFTDLDQKEFELMFMEIHRHVQMAEFFKVLAQTIEVVKTDYTKANEIIVKAVDYIRLKKRPFENLKIVKNELYRVT